MYANTEGRVPLKRMSQGECNFTFRKLGIHLRVLAEEMNLKVYVIDLNRAFLNLEAKRGAEHLNTASVGATSVYCTVVQQSSFVR